MHSSNQFSLGFLLQQITLGCMLLALGGYLHSLPQSRAYDALVLRMLVVTLIGAVIGAFVGGFSGRPQRFALGFGLLAMLGSGLLVWFLSA